MEMTPPRASTTTSSKVTNMNNTYTFTDKQVHDLQNCVLTKMLSVLDSNDDMADRLLDIMEILEHRENAND